MRLQQIMFILMVELYALTTERGQPPIFDETLGAYDENNRAIRWGWLDIHHRILQNY